MSFEDDTVRHQMAANCAEMFCLHLWSLDLQSCETDLDFCNFVTVWRTGDHIRVKRPCEGHGCEKVLQRLQHDHPGIMFVTELNESLDKLPLQLERSLKGDLRYGGVLRETCHYSIFPDLDFVDDTGTMAHKTTVFQDRAPRFTDDAYDDKLLDRPPPVERPFVADMLATNWIPTPPRSEKSIRRGSLKWDECPDE